MADLNERPFLDAEDVVNEAFQRMGKDVKISDDQNIDEKIAAITVEDLLKELETNEFEKLYIASASRSKYS